MSSTRRLRRPGDDRDRERRHMAWLNTDDKRTAIRDHAEAARARYGRGFWFASPDLDNPGGFTDLLYIAEAAISELPAGSARDVVARMVATYNPDTHIVVVIEDEGRISAYKVRHVQPALN